MTQIQKTRMQQLNTEISFDNADQSVTYTPETHHYFYSQ